jgi:hypothetical protein
VFTETAPALKHLFPDVSFVEIHIHFVIDLGPSFSLSKLVRSGQDNKWCAYTLFTLLEDIHGHPEHIGAHMPHGTHNSKDPWEDEQKEHARFEHSDPDVLIGQSSDEQEYVILIFIFIAQLVLVTTVLSLLLAQNFFTPD